MLILVKVALAAGVVYVYLDGSISICNTTDCICY